jgi:hypothetical protein
MPEDLRCGHMISDDEGAAYRCVILVTEATNDHGGEHYFKREPAGRVAPIAPDPERDRRRAAYNEADRVRARRALEAWFRAVEAGDLWAIMLADYELAVSRTFYRHYGVPLAGCPNDGFTCPDHPGVTHHNADYVADLADSDCLRLTERAEYCPAAGSPRCESCVWRPADGPRPA